VVVARPVSDLVILRYKSTEQEPTMTTTAPATTTATVKTASKAAYMILRAGPTGAHRIGYAYTLKAAETRARRAGRFAVVAPIIDGKVTVELPPAFAAPARDDETACTYCGLAIARGGRDVAFYHVHTGTGDRYCAR
jgi:hypothetical protein